MKSTRIPILLAMLLGTVLLQGQTPVQIVSAAKVGTSGKVRVTFNVPVTPAGMATLLADDFSGAGIDPARWRVNPAPFEPGGTTTAESGVVQADGVVTVDVEVDSPAWPGISLATAGTFSSSPSEPLVFEVDRVSHDEDGSATRTGIWITDVDRSHYVFFGENEGGGGSAYHRLIGATGDNPTLGGAITPLVNGEDFNDLDAHRLRAVLDGSTVRLYLDDQFATEIPFPFSSGLVFEFGTYAAETGDLVTGVFDNARVGRLAPVALSSFSINNGATVTGVSLTSDPKVLELTTTGVAAGSEYTLTISGVQSAVGVPIQPDSTVSIRTGTVNSAYAAAVLADGPLAYYQMDQMEGTTVPNLGALGTAATYLPGPRSLLTQGPGLPDFPGFDRGNAAAYFDGIGTFTDDEGAFQLEGVGNYIDTQGPLLADLPAFTIEAWIKPADLDEDRLGVLGTFCTEFGFANPGTIHIFTCDGGAIYAPYPFPFNEWHHLVVTGTGTNLTLYADGEVLAQVDEETDTYGGEDRNVYIGGGGIFDDVLSDGSGNWFPGGIDEVAIYSTALPADRVKAHFDAAFAIPLRPTVTITRPVENAAIAPGASVTIDVQTSAAAGRTVSRVEFFDRFTRLGESTASPFSLTLPSIDEGRHALTAEVYDDLGVSTISAPVRFTVGTPRPLLVMVVASVEQLTESDAAVQAHLIASDFDVQLVPANGLSAADVSEASLVVVPVIRVDSVAETLRGLPVPILTWDQDLEPTFLFTEDEVDVAWGDTPDVQFAVNMVGADHPLAAGFPAGFLEVNEYGQEFAWGVPTAEAIVIATLADDPTRPVLYAYDQGAALVDDSEAPDKRVFFMLTDDTFLALNEDGLKLFDAAVAWTARVVQPAPRFNPPTIEQGNIVLSWSGGGTLQEAATAEGDWTDIAGAASPHPFPVAGPGRFFRIRR